MLQFITFFLKISKATRVFFADFLFPCFCVGCSKEGAYLCADCAQALTRALPVCFGCGIGVSAGYPGGAGRTCVQCRRTLHISSSFSPFLFQERSVRELVHLLKYGRIRPIGAVFASLLAAYMTLHGARIPADAICIPIPLSFRRKRARGFNQSTLVARELASLLHVPIFEGVLVKLRQTKAQVGLSAEERKHNLARSFAVRSSWLICRRTVVLIDDVKTTGATLAEAARVLKEAGAKRVWAITVAR